MIAKFGTLAYVAIAAYLWIFQIDYEVNRTVSAILTAVLIATTLSLLRLRPLSVCALAAGAYVTTFFVASFWAGDWSMSERIPATCFTFGKADLHIHHWVKGWIFALWHVVLLAALYWTSGADDDLRTRVLRRFGSRSLRFAAVMVTLMPIIMVVGKAGQSM